MCTYDGTYVLELTRLTIAAAAAHPACYPRAARAPARPQPPQAAVTGGAPVVLRPRRVRHVPGRSPSWRTSAGGPPATARPATAPSARDAPYVPDTGHSPGRARCRGGPGAGGIPWAPPTSFEEASASLDNFKHVRVPGQPARTRSARDRSAPLRGDGTISLVGIYSRVRHAAAARRSAIRLAVGRVSRVDECTDPSGDPVVMYDQVADRWILTQFTTRGIDSSRTSHSTSFFNCVAVSATPDPTGPVLPVRVLDRLQFSRITRSTGIFRDLLRHHTTPAEFRRRGPETFYGHRRVRGWSATRCLEGGPPTPARSRFILDSAVVPDQPDGRRDYSRRTVDGKNQAEQRPPRSRSSAPRTNGGPYGCHVRRTSTSGIST